MSEKQLDNRNMIEGKTALEIEAAEALSLLSMGGHAESVRQTEQRTNTNPASMRDVNKGTPSPGTTQANRTSDTRARASTTSQAPVAPAAMNQTALQAYLIHQQRLAGIAPDKIVMMDELRNNQQQAGWRRNRAPPPPIVQITNDGIVIPHIPPAQFNGAVPQAPAVTSQPAGALRAALRSQLQRQGGGSVARGGSPSLRSRQTLRSRPRGGLGRIRPGTHRVSSSLQVSGSSGANGLMRTSQPERQNVPLKLSSATSLVIRPRHTPQLKTGHESDAGIVNNDFSIFNAIMRHPELAFTLAKHLRARELISLYAISRDFHNLMDSRFTTMILTQATTKAPESANIFPFRCYQNLCIEDPARNPHPDLARAGLGVSRKVPSLRWLIMIFWRESVVMDIMRLMHRDGVGMPRECITAIKKLWFLMDIPDNARRIGIIQNSNLWSNADLFFATLFFVKLDMRFTDPLSGGGRDGMRRLVLAQPSFSLLWKLLRRTALQTHFETLKAYVRWKYLPLPHEADKTMFGVAPEEIGALQFEGYGKTGSKIRLQRVDELVLKEGIRRRLNMHERYTDMFLWGYVNPRMVQAAKEQKQQQTAETQGRSDLLRITPA
ncbi:hypothetical protein DTO271G3_266 [Paecilomyces variotii]|nr:hypothetical protein DTO271G3_266 [Paecilomyces variotii]